MPADLVMLDVPPDTGITFCEPWHVAHVTRDGLAFCRVCRVFHHDDYTCQHAILARNASLSVTGPAADDSPREWCDDCDDYHDSIADDCPAAMIECDDCDMTHARGGDCPREFCANCDDYHDRDRWGNAECPGWYCDDCNGSHPHGENCPQPYCSDCDSNMPRDHECSSGLLEDYSYTPDLQFMGEGPSFYGMEFEVSAYGSALAEAVSGANHHDVLYFKEDGSVEGFEMVTHPMTFEWAMENFPWHVLADFRRAGCEIDESENGIHVHVSRAAFAGTAHQYRWIKFLYRNQDLSQAVARRHSGQWAGFSRHHRMGQGAHLKMRKLRDAYYRGDRAVYDRYIQAASDDSTGDRYSAVNCTNADTFEVRIFASTLDATEAQSALQFVAATVEYTRTLTSHQVIRESGWDEIAFTEWLHGQDGKYDSLLQVMEATR